MPKSIGVCGDVLLAARVSASVGLRRCSGLFMLLLAEHVRLIGMLQRLSRAFMSGQVIPFSVSLAGAVGMGSKVTVLSRYLL